MKRLTSLAALLLWQGGALAHHSNVLFDNTQEVTATGTVTEFQWHNPHTYIQMVVKDEQGVEKEWSVEMAAPMYLYNLGWRPSTLKPGDTITVTVWPLRSGESGGLARSVLDASGERIGIEP